MYINIQSPQTKRSALVRYYQISIIKIEPEGANIMAIIILPSVTLRLDRDRFRETLFRSRKASHKACRKHPSRRYKYLATTALVGFFRRSLADKIYPRYASSDTNLFWRISCVTSSSISSSQSRSNWTSSCMVQSPSS